MQEVTAVIIAALIPVAAAGIVGIVKSIQFFARMDVKVTSTSDNVSTIMDNHLPHIYTRLGHIEGRLNVGEDSTSK